MAVPRSVLLTEPRPIGSGLLIRHGTKVRLAALPTRTYISFIPEHNARIGGCRAARWNIGRQRRHNQQQHRARIVPQRFPQPSSQALPAIPSRGHCSAWLRAPSATLLLRDGENRSHRPHRPPAQRGCRRLPTHVEAFLDELKPVGPREQFLAQSLADNAWRLERISV